MNTLHVACAADEGYVAHSAAMLHSLLTHRGELGLQVHYLHSPRLAAGAQGLLEGMVTSHGGAIAFHAIPDRAVAGLPVDEGSTPAIWYRTLLPELLDGLDRVLYIDADAVAVDSVEPLWATDLGGHHLAAVTNVFEPWSADRPRQLGLAGPEVYFNTGVLLLDLKLLRRDRCGDELRDFARRHRDRLLWPEQDTFNVVLAQRRLPLHPRWNCMNSVMHLEESVAVFGADVVAEARRNPAIRHFEGPGINKPWNVGCDRALREAYLRHRSQSPWPQLPVSAPAGESRGARRWLRGVRSGRRR